MKGGRKGGEGLSTVLGPLRLTWSTENAKAMFQELVEHVTKGYVLSRRQRGQDMLDIAQSALDRIAKNLADIGAISFEDYLDGQCPPPPAPAQVPSAASEPDGNAVTRLYQACQSAFRNTDALKFEFIEQTGSRSELLPAFATTPDLDHRQAMHLDHHKTRRRAAFVRDTARLCKKERGKARGRENRRRHGRTGFSDRWQRPDETHPGDVQCRQCCPF